MTVIYLMNKGYIYHLHLPCTKIVVFIFHHEILNINSFTPDYAKWTVPFFRLMEI